jgi:hypothetical protein
MRLTNNGEPDLQLIFFQNLAEFFLIVFTHRVDGKIRSQSGLAKPAWI